MNYIVKNQTNSTKVDILKIKLPSSKSEANRLLIIQALCDQKEFLIQNLSAARDTVSMRRLLDKRKQLSIFDVLDAGTAMRFLSSFLAFTTTETVTLTGTERMQKRPIGTLVNALKTIGAAIDYEKEIGFPPLIIRPLLKQIENNIIIEGNISSQYISSLLMVAPYLPKGLTITIKEPIYSLPYINMTIGLMEMAGISIDRQQNTYNIQPQAYKPTTFIVESDWSGASYWFSYTALSEVGKQLHLSGLREGSFQGDQAIVGIMEKLGVKSSFDETGVSIEKVSIELPEKIRIDFKEFPDLAQTVVACCAALGVNLEMTGLESLKIKETDRVAALHQELKQFNCHLREEAIGHWTLSSNDFSFPKEAIIHTYEDHRMAMSFMPLSLMGKLLIQDIEVVNKSYPSFWDDCTLAGLKLLPQ